MHVTPSSCALHRSCPGAATQRKNEAHRSSGPVPLSGASAQRYLQRKPLQGVSRHLHKCGIHDCHRSLIDTMYQKPWVVFCEPSLASPKHVFQYLGQYIHRVAITNQRILSITETSVSFRMKDYSDKGKTKSITLAGVEFLRRFCLHILPKGFMKIRYFGICASRVRATIINQTKWSSVFPRLSQKVSNGSPERMSAFVRLAGRVIWCWVESCRVSDLRPHNGPVSLY